MNAITEKVTKPLEGIKIAGYVGCQTNRPFGIDGESFENPQYLDNMIAAVGAEPSRSYEKKVSCCGGALAFSEPDKSFNLIKPILESAMDRIPGGFFCDQDQNIGVYPNKIINIPNFNLDI